MTMRNRPLVRIVAGLGVLLAFDGLDFAVATILMPIVRRQVTTEAIVACGVVAWWRSMIFEAQAKAVARPNAPSTASGMPRDH